MRQKFTLWSDTVFIFCMSLTAAFCLLRFYLRELWAAAALSLALAAAGTALLHLWMRARRAKKHRTREQQQKIADLAFHLAMEEPQNSAELIARSLRAAGFDDAHAEGGCVTAAGKRAFLRFRLEKVTADELRPAVVAAGRQKFALGGAFTAEAEKLAAAFGVELWDAEKVYALVQGAGAMPDPLFAPPPAPKRKLAFRLRRAAWRGYAFSGGFLLLFSLWAIFPIYYLVSGGLLLAAAVLVRLFGKAE